LSGSELKLSKRKEDSERGNTTLAKGGRRQGEGKSEPEARSRTIQDRESLSGGSKEVWGVSAGEG